MKFAKKWLENLIGSPLAVETLSEYLTMAGLEVDSIEKSAPEIKGVLVAQITTCEPHPNNEKLQLLNCQTGKEDVSIVCGAHNARVGLKVALALPGAVFNGFDIKPATISGVESFGMLCSKAELGMAEESEVILELPNDAPLGESIVDYLNLDDDCIEIDLTPNRGDCLSLVGIAKEVATLFGKQFSPKSIEAVAPSIQTTKSIDILEPEDCPHYVGRMIEEVDASKESPLWLTEALRTSGLRSVSIVVDIMNYVMLEMGQPMHAFDTTKVSGGIVVRKAKQGESFISLDNQEIKLETNTLVIADQKEVLAMAGVMGGLNSGVTKETTQLLLESAYFDPKGISGKARNYALHTDSSFRFERGVDPSIQVTAIERASALILQLCGGQLGPVMEKTLDEYMPSPITLTLRYHRIAKILGIELTKSRVEQILTSLGCELRELNVDGIDSWQVKVPSHRSDIEREEDLIEELARINGYHKIPIILPKLEPKIKLKSDDNIPLPRLKRLMMDLGYQEIITYSFVDPKIQDLIRPQHPSLSLINPISQDMKDMRTSLWPGLLQTLSYNQARRLERLKIFETGLRFRESKGIIQSPVLSALVTGPMQGEGWDNNSKLMDFFDIKGELEALWKLTRKAPLQFQAHNDVALHPGQCAKISYDGREIGMIGALHPELQAKFEYPNPVFLFEIELEPLQGGLLTSFERPSKYPWVRRDLALLLKTKVPSEPLVEFAANQMGSLLKKAFIFDLYEGKNLSNGLKSLGLGLILQHSSRTLVDEEVDNLINKLVVKLKEEFGAELRD